MKRKVFMFLLGFTVAVAVQCDAGTDGGVPISSKMPKSGDSAAFLAGSDRRISYPDHVKTRPLLRGVMLPLRPCTEDDFRTLHEWGATLARYQMSRHSFLAIGKNRDLEEYDRWLDERLDHLDRDVLPFAAKYGIKIVVDLHTPPGGRDPDLDWTMFHDEKYADHFVKCWQRIASRFKRRPEVYGFDLVNEPAQTRPAVCDYWTLQKRAAEAVREIDPHTTIIMEANRWDAPSAFSQLKPLPMDNVIYQVHMYVPQAFTHQGIGSRSELKEKTSYPDKARGWDIDFIRKTLAPVRDFERKYGAKIYVGEFSAIAWAEGADRYMADCISVFEEYGWDWTYHAFREYSGWSVEHEGPDASHMKPSSDNPRRRALLDGFRQKPRVALRKNTDGGDVQKIIDNALASGLRYVRIPKSVYVLEPGSVASIHLRNVKGVTVDFQGSELQGEIRSGMIRLDGCEDVAFKNAVIDYPHRLPFTQGVIRNVGPDGEWDVEIAEGYEDRAGGWPIQVYDGKTGDLVNPMRMGGEKIVRTGERRYSVTGGKNKKGRAGDVVVWSFGCDTYGNTQSISNRAHAVCLVNCRNCRMEDITVYSTPGSNGFREMLGDGGNTYLRCSVVPRPAESDPVKRSLRRYRSGNHDAFNSRGMKVGPKLIDCVACNHCDDDVNIHGPYQFVSSVRGRVARAFVKDMYAGTLKVGDPVQFVTKDGYVPLAQPVVSAIRQVVPTDAELAEVKKGLNSQVAAGCNTMVEVTFDRDCDALRPGSLFASQNQNGNGFLLQGCRFGPNRARGFSCNASYGTVANCTFDRLEQAGVLSRPSYHWLEGGASRNVRFKDCTFIDCGVFFGVHKEMETTPDCHRNIAFAGCRFKGSRARLDVRCCRGFAVDDNTFDLPAAKAMGLTHVDHAVVRRLDYGAHPKQHMMFMRPERAAGRVPVKVRIHGGSWQTGYAVDHELFPVLDSVADGLAAVAALQYRTVDEARKMGENPPVKGVYDDCCAAVRYLQAHADELGIDPKRISIHGGSAGGCAALMMALKDSNPLGVAAIHANIAQTTLDPKEIDEILPGFRYGGHAFGLPRASGDFMRRREEYLPMIREWSPLALLGKADPGRLPPLHLTYSHRYANGRVPDGMNDDRVHDAAFGDLFVKLCRELGVECTLTVAGRREHPARCSGTNSAQADSGD
ncbi:MAG: hypothetical protein E7046_04460, partial [Lentisphaerae bacterium]|nr:hypothetical protein [Lentisphaerota bacterium]